MNFRNISLDLLKIILAFLVVLLHCRFFSEYNETFSSLITQGLSRIGVPTFFLINGYFFKYIIDKNTIKKWIVRVLILYAVWTLIYAPLWFHFNMKSILFNVFIGFHHLWYIKAMLVCGIMLFALKKKNTKILVILSLFLFLIGVILQYLANFHLLKTAFLDNINNLTYLYRNFIFIGFPFFTMGYLIHKNNWQQKLTQKKIFILLSISTLLLFIESYLNYYYTKEAIDNLFTLLFICPLIFMYTINLKLNYKIDSKKIALISTAIYLVHPWVMEMLTTFFKIQPTVLSLLTIIISTIFSLIIIKMNTKIKYLL